MQTIATTLRQKAVQIGEKEAVVYGKVRLTFRMLNNRINQLAHALDLLCDSMDNRLAVLSENSHQYLETYFAAAKIGLCIVPLNFMLSDEEIIQRLTDSDTVCCLVGSGYEERAKSIRPALSTVTHWITMENRQDNFLYFDDLLKNCPETEPTKSVDNKQLAILAYTNGTTGPPKGVMLTHRNIMQSVMCISDLMQYRHIDVGCIALPFYQTEVINAFCLLMAGGKVVINRKVDATAILSLIQDERCTHINLVPELIDWLQRQADFDRYNLSNLKLMSYTGSSFSPAMLLNCVEKYWTPFLQAYGSTETVGCSITALNPEDHILDGPGSKRIASAGKPLNGVKIKIVNTNYSLAASGEVGEIAVKSNNIMLGYWKRPKLTKQVLKDGWFHTGDLGYIDNSGYLYILGRKKEQSIVGDDRIDVVSISGSSGNYPVAMNHS